MNLGMLLFRCAFYLPPYREVILQRTEWLSRHLLPPQPTVMGRLTSNKCVFNNFTGM